MKIFLSVIIIVSVIIGSYFYFRISDRERAAQMIMVGFEGLALTPDNPIYRDIADNHIGGVILFNHRAWDKTSTKNIKDADQLKSLIGQLQGISKTPLFVAIDQEGGQVARLSSEFGVSVYSAAELGERDDVALTRSEADKTAQVLNNLGINVNLAPCVDVALNQDSIIKAKNRAFSSDNPEQVARHAEQFIMAYRDKNILPVLKHFPGHGSARGDTHAGYVDITNDYRDSELTPYRILLPKYPDVGVMVAHVFNSNVDKKWPLSMSYQNVSKNLKGDLKFTGIVFSDDLQMGALTKQHSWHDIIVGAVNAGNDVLVIGNNLSYEPDIADRTLDIIERAIKDGEIDRGRIDDAYRKIMAVKSRLMKGKK